MEDKTKLNIKKKYKQVRPKHYYKKINDNRKDKRHQWYLENQERLKAKTKKRYQESEKYQEIAKRKEEIRKSIKIEPTKSNKPLNELIKEQKQIIDDKIKSTGIDIYKYLEQY
jgi:hypothetical protein